jgi:hypothetical protein
MVGVRWKEGKERYMIGYKSTTSRVSVVFFFESPAPTPLQTTFFALCLCVSFFCFGPFGVGGVLQCSTSPLGTELERAPSPAPVPCFCHLSIHNISCFSPSPMQAVRPPQQNHLGGPVLDGLGAFSFWSVALHTCTIGFVCLSFMPRPPCPMFPNASPFVCYPAPNGLSFRVSWWIQTLFLGDPRSHL